MAGSVAGGGGGGGADTSVSYTSRSGGGLPQGWEMRHTATGRAYYVNHDRRITQWAPPGPGVGGSAAAGAGEQKSPYQAHAAAAASAFVPSSAPPVVQQQRVPPSGPVFVDGGAPGGNGGYGGGGGGVPAAGGGALPGHIEVRTNADGRVYYVNHRTKVTSWAPPPREDWW